MDHVTIRRVTPEDFADIYALSLELGYSYPKEKLRARIQYIIDHTRDIILVAEIEAETETGKEVVGYIHASPYELMVQESIMNVLGFVVKEKNRGIGIGDKLMTELEDMAKSCGFTGLRLTSGANRTGAHRFYEKHGFVNQKMTYKFTKKLL